MPVDVGTGAVIAVSHDFDLPGTVRFLWKRWYSSNSAVDSWLGKKWSCPYFMRIDRVPAGYALASAHGGTILFEYSRDRPTPILRNFAANMELEDHGHFLSVLHWHHGDTDHERYRFHPAGNGQWVLSAIENLAGHRIALEYDAFRRPVRITQELEGRNVEMVYNSEGRIAAILFLSETGERRVLVSYDYDREGNLISVQRAGDRRTLYGYDFASRVLKETNPLGSSFHFRYDDQGRCIHTGGDGGRLERRIYYSRAPRFTRVTNSDGQATTYYINPAGQVMQEVTPRGAVKTTEYDKFGRPLAVTNAVGGVIAYSYDDRGNRSSVTHPDGARATLVHNDLHLMFKYIDPMGLPWTYEYDDRGNVISFTNPLGVRLSCERNERGLVTRSNMPGGLVITRRYGPQLRWVEAADQYSLLSRVEYDEYGNQIAIFDAGGLLQRAVYDSANRPIEVSDGAGRINRYTWNPLNEMLEQVGPDRGWERREYDPFGQIVAHITPLGVLRLEYDKEERVTAVVNRVGELLERSYDAENNLIRETGFDGRTVTYEHDLAGRVSLEVLPDGRSTMYCYTPAGDLMGRESSDGLVEAFTYDANGNLIAANTADTSLVLERDALGRVRAEVQNGWRIEYQFDVDGNRFQRRISGPQSDTIRFRYDLRGRPLTLEDRTGVFQEFAWDDLNRLIRRSVRGVSEDLTYSVQRRLQDQRVMSSQGRILASRRYVYDEMNTLVARLEPRRGDSRFDHDDIGRLTAVIRDNHTSEFYRYDANSTLLETHRGVRTVAPGGRTLSDGQRTYEYDANGCVAAIRSATGVWLFSYDVDNRLVSATAPDGVISNYTYDAARSPLRETRQRGDYDFSLAKLCAGRAGPQYGPHGSLLVFRSRATCALAWRRAVVPCQ
jgi:YD repeat-containing protein